jgi:hypothetical protein
VLHRLIETAGIIGMWLFDCDGETRFRSDNFPREIRFRASLILEYAQFATSKTKPRAAGMKFSMEGRAGATRASGRTPFGPMNLSVRQSPH